MEVQRQAGIAFAHRALGVPHSDAFILKSMALSRIAESSALPASGKVQLEAGISKTSGGPLKQTEVHSKIQNADGVPL